MTEHILHNFQVLSCILKTIKEKHYKNYIFNTGFLFEYETNALLTKQNNKTKMYFILQIKIIRKLPRKIILNKNVADDFISDLECSGAAGGYVLMINHCICLFKKLNKNITQALY